MHREMVFGAGGCGCECVGSRESGVGSDILIAGRGAICSEVLEINAAVSCSLAVVEAGIA